jgi:hypothetical protein
LVHGSFPHVVKFKFMLNMTTTFSLTYQHHDYSQTPLQM